MALDLAALIPGMLGAAAGVLDPKWPAARAFAESEFRKTTENLDLIARLFADGEIDEQQARLLFDLQRSASRTVLLSLQGIGLIAADEAINAALGVLKGTVNAALGFALI